jgi:hypothetical protein
MRKTFLFIIILAATFGSCTKESIRYFQDDTTLSTPYGTWKLISRENYATNQVFYKEQSDVQGYCNNPASCDIILTFSRVNSADIITGHTITNTVTGDFTFNPGLRQLNILSFGGTKVGEPRWSYNIWDNIYDVGKYKVNNEYLRLYLNSKQESLTFKRE